MQKSSLVMAALYTARALHQACILEHQGRSYPSSGYSQQFLLRTLPGRCQGRLPDL